MLTTQLFSIFETQFKFSFEVLKLQRAVCVCDSTNICYINAPVIVVYQENVRNKWAFVSHVFPFINPHHLTHFKVN